MKISELKELLEKHDDETEIRVCVSDDSDTTWSIFGISKDGDTLYIDCGWEDKKQKYLGQHK